MKVRGMTVVLALLAMLIGVSPALAQVQTGEITGKVTDDTGALLPGVTVTLTSPALIQPQTATSSETGSFRFPRHSDRHLLGQVRAARLQDRRP